MPRPANSAARQRSSRTPQKALISGLNPCSPDGTGLATSLPATKHLEFRPVSLNGIAASALSALKTSSAALGVVSNNVANINTPGYARRVVNEQTLAAGGQLMGVDIASVQRVADQFLQQENLSAGGSASQYDTMAGLFTQLNGLLGGPGDNQSLATGLTNLSGGFRHRLPGAQSPRPATPRCSTPCNGVGQRHFQRLRHHLLAAEPGRQPGGQFDLLHQCPDPADLHSQPADQDRHRGRRHLVGPAGPARQRAEHAQPDHGHPGQPAVRMAASMSPPPTASIWSATPMRS